MQASGAAIARAQAILDQAARRILAERIAGGAGSPPTLDEDSDPARKGSQMSKSAKTRITVEVTEKDIERAHKNDSYNCVVAQAVARTVPDATRIDVDTQSIRFTTAGERRIYMTPYAVQGYVIAFDAGDPIEPFSFQLRDPKRVARKLHTEAGRKVNRARQAARRQATKAQVAKDPTKTITSEKQASVLTSADPSEAAKAAYTEAKAEVKGAQLTESKGHRAPPKVFKKKTRTYGHRLLRINQES